MRSLWVPNVALAALTFTGVSFTVMAQAGKTVADRVYTDGQAQRGQAIYDAQCSACHGAALAGALGPPHSPVRIFSARGTGGR